MTIGLVGRKVGMTRIFTDDGGTLPVTVLDVSDNRVTQIKTAEKDGYVAVQIAFGKRRATRVNKELAGHLAKAAVEDVTPEVRQTAKFALGRLGPDAREATRPVLQQISTAGADEAVRTRAVELLRDMEKR